MKTSKKHMKARKKQANKLLCVAFLELVYKCQDTLFKITAVDVMYKALAAPIIAKAL